MKRGASKRMMLLIAGVGAILLLVTLGYMLANHREGTTSQTGPDPKTQAAPPDPKIQLLIDDLMVLYPISRQNHGITKRVQNSAGNVIGFACKDVSRLNRKGKNINYEYTGLTDCDLMNPNRKDYKGDGIATSKTGEKITLTKEILTQALNQALVKLTPKKKLKNVSTT